MTTRQFILSLLFITIFCLPYREVGGGWYIIPMAILAFINPYFWDQINTMNKESK